MNYIRHINAFYSCVRTDNRLTSAHVSLYMALFQYWNYNRFKNPFPIYRDGLMQLSKIGSKNTYHNCIKDLHQAGYIFYTASLSKFQPAKISIVRLDKSEVKDQALQLDIFNPNTESNPRNPKPLNPENDIEKSELLISDTCPTFDTHVCPINDTVSVPHLIPISTDFDTGTVPDMGHFIKQNIYKTVNSVCKHTQLFQKNIKVAQSINGFKAIPTIPTVQSNLKNKKPPSRMPAPKIEEVQTFFSANNYPIDEAKKFFYYNNGKAWQLNSNTPISDWQSLAHKWMLNQQSNATKKQQSVYHTEVSKDYSEPL